LIECVVFDVDDTLYLERDYVRSGFDAVGRLVAKEWNEPAFAEQCWQCFLDGRRGDIFNEAAAALKLTLPPEAVSQFVNVYREHEPAIAFAPDAGDVVRWVAGHFRSGVVTDGPAASQSRKVRALGLNGLAGTIVLTGELGPGKGKPAIDAFQLIERTQQVMGPACVYVADNPDKDFAGPKQLGWHTIRVRRELGLHAAKTSGNDVDREIHGLTNLAETIKTL
jgi:putative hydrolase of the HAD superfamily